MPVWYGALYSINVSVGSYSLNKTTTGETISRGFEAGY